MAKAVYTGFPKGKQADSLGEKATRDTGRLGKQWGWGGVGMGRHTLVFWKGLMCLGRLTIGEGVWHGDPMSSQLLECPKLVDAV